MPLLLRRLPTYGATRSTRYSSSAASIGPPPLIGSAPHYPRHLVIHTPHLSRTWPSHLESVSFLYKHLGTRWTQSPHAQLKQLGFGVSEGVETRETGATWDPERSKFETPPPESTEEVYSATLYPDFLHFPSFSLSSLESFESKFLALPPPPALPSSGSTSSSEPATSHIYVCTHGSRDCRCGDLGEKLYQSILSELKRRKLGGELAVAGSSGAGNGHEGVRVSRISHIGGHKWAANALVYKKGGACDWYGLLNESDVSSLIDAASSTSPSTEPLYANWRGRLNFTPEETKSQFLSHTSSSAPSASNKKQKVGQELGEQVVIKFVTYEGEKLDLVGYEGESLMQLAKRGDAPSILATCGGNCECATCHVHIAPILTASPETSTANEMAKGRQPLPVPDLPTSLPEMTDEEDEQLDFAIGADDDSRLACQIPVTKELGEWVKRGGRIKLPRY
ncbi:hypothetical protein JCM11491_001460 [Sporobolomyces phaffii]